MRWSCVAVVVRLIVPKDSLVALEAARKCTLAAASARIELFVEHKWEMPRMPRRYMLDYGHYAKLFASGKEWAGRSGGIAVPARERFEQLLALEVDVWIDDLHVRRIAVRSSERTETLELWDFGARVDDLDWTRLPTFRSPEEADRVADQRRSRWRHTLGRLTNRHAT